MIDEHSIIITAATPMVEDAEKSFLNDIIKEEDEENQEDSSKQLKRDTQLEKEVAEAVDEILEEARIETTKRPQQKKSETSQKSESKEKPIIEHGQREGANVKMEKHPTRPGPPAVPPPPPPIKTTSIDDENQFEVNFEANFDDAFGEPELPRQLGGRASIPDELEPHQLERLQNLKESNA